MKLGKTSSPIIQPLLNCVESTMEDPNMSREAHVGLIHLEQKRIIQRFGIESYPLSRENYERLQLHLFDLFNRLFTTWQGFKGIKSGI